MSLVAVHPAELDLDTFARAADVHPDLVRRLVTLGLLEAREDTHGTWLATSDVATVARIQRLRAGFCLTYASVGLVLDLLQRVAALEAELRAQQRRDDVPRRARPEGG